MIRTKHLTLILLLALLLNACSSAAEPTVTQVPTQQKPTATDRPTTSPPTATPTLPPPTATNTVAAATATQSPPPATDTPVTEDIFAFLEIGPDEWVRGPADAAVTLVEYADFQ